MLVTPAANNTKPDTASCWPFFEQWLRTKAGLFENVSGAIFSTFAVFVQHKIHYLALPVMTCRLGPCEGCAVSACGNGMLLNVTETWQEVMFLPGT